MPRRIFDVPVEHWQSRDIQPRLKIPLEQAVLILCQAGNNFPEWVKFVGRLAQASPTRVEALTKTSPGVFKMLPQLLSLSSQEEDLAFPEAQLRVPTILFMRQLHDSILLYTENIQANRSKSDITFSLRLWVRRISIYLEALEQELQQPTN